MWFNDFFYIYILFFLLKFIIKKTQNFSDDPIYHILQLSVILYAKSYLIAKDNCKIYNGKWRKIKCVQKFEMLWKTFKPVEKTICQI